MEVNEPLKPASRRGRKATGIKTHTVGMSIPLWLYDRLKKDAKTKEDAKELDICTVQKIIRDILFDHYKSDDQLSLFGDEPIK